jgi:malonyl-CoA O-methyltransferase
MHDIGDELMKAGFSQPVMDMEIITMTYSSVDYLMRDLKDIGASNTTKNRRKGLTGKVRMQAFKQAYKHFQQADGLYPATYEVIYGHAWMPDQGLQKPAGVEKFIPIKAL